MPIPVGPASSRPVQEAMRDALGGASRLTYNVSTDTIDIGAANVTKNGAALGLPHLTEVTAQSLIEATWRLRFTDGPGGAERFIITPGGYFSQIVPEGLFVDFNNDGGAFELYRSPNDAYPRFGWAEDGSLHWGPGSTAPDLALRRASAGIMENPALGGGLRLTSPDGLTTKTIRLSNAGVVEAVP